MECLNMLLSRLTKEDVNAKNDEGLTPLHIAANRDRAEMIPVLVDKGADINAKSEDGETPLDLAKGVSINALQNLGALKGEAPKPGTYQNATERFGYGCFDQAHD